MTITDRIDAITGLTPQYLHTYLPAPKSCKIEVTSRCNFQCHFCAHSMKLRPEGTMEFDLFKRLLLEMREAGVEEIGLFFLGEPLIRPDLEKLIHFAKHEAKFPYCFVTTNGSLATPKRVDRMIRAGLDSLKFSLNYSDAEQFAEIASVKPALYHTMIANVMKAKDVRDAVEQETGHRCGLYGSYIEYDGEQGERMAALVDGLRESLDEIYALPLYSQAELTGDGERDRGWKVTAGNRGRSANLRDPLPCWSLFTEAHITWDAKLVGCCFSHDERFTMGDLKEQSFMDAWNSREFGLLRAAHLQKDVSGTECEQCVAYA